MLPVQMRVRGHGHRRGIVLGTPKEAGLARPLLRAAGEKQEQGFFNFEVLNAMLQRRTVRGLELRSHGVTRMIGGRH